MSITLAGAHSTSKGVNYTRDFFDFVEPWTYVFRCKSSTAVTKALLNAKKICETQSCHYVVSGGHDGYTIGVTNAWDCSGFVFACYSSGTGLPQRMASTDEMYSVFTSSSDWGNYFTCIANRKTGTNMSMLNSGSGSRPGDIFIYENPNYNGESAFGHTELIWGAVCGIKEVDQDVVSITKSYGDNWSSEVTTKKGFLNEEENLVIGWKIV